MTLHAGIVISDSQQYPALTRWDDSSLPVFSISCTVHLQLFINIDRLGQNLYINLACLSVCLFVCLYPINVITAEPISPKFFVGHLGTPGKVYESSKFQIFVSIKIRLSLNFFVKIRELFLFENVRKNVTK